MPVHTVDVVSRREDRLRKKLREAGGKLEAPTLRKLRKRVRRAQRKRRRLTAAAARKPGKAAKAEGS